MFKSQPAASNSKVAKPTKELFKLRETKIQEPQEPQEPNNTKNHVLLHTRPNP